MISSLIKNKILKHYGKAHYFDYPGLIIHLTHNKIDNFEVVNYVPVSINCSYDNSMAMFTYSDNSILIITPNDIISK